jgi:cysteine sulfinate desulfinase/cysteine desulfurase-like protein
VHDDAGPSWLGPIVNVAVRGCEHRALDAELDLEGLAVARGSACRREVDEHSEVVARAHPDEPWRARSCVRFSLGWPSTAQEVDAALECFARRLAGPRMEELH